MKVGKARVKPPIIGIMGAIWWGTRETCRRPPLFQVGGT